MAKASKKPAVKKAAAKKPGTRKKGKKNIAADEQTEGLTIESIDGETVQCAPAEN